MILPTVLAHWDVDLDSISLSIGQKLWPYITDTLRPLRNAVAHDGASATPEEAGLAVEAAELLLQAVVRPVSKNLGFTLETTGKWSEIRSYTRTEKFETKSPFKL